MGKAALWHPNCCFLICMQISQEADKVVWYSHPFQIFPQFVVIYVVKGFGIIIKAETDVFLEFSCFFDNPTDAGNLIFGSSAFYKSSFNIWKFSVHTPLKPTLENFEHYFASVWDECICAVVWAFFSTACLWDWNENWPFPVLWTKTINRRMLDSTKKWYPISTGKKEKPQQDGRRGSIAFKIKS